MTKTSSKTQIRPVLDRLNLNDEQQALLTQVAEALVVEGPNERYKAAMQAAEALVDLAAVSLEKDLPGIKIVELLLLATRLSELSNVLDETPTTHEQTSNA